MLVAVIEVAGGLAVVVVVVVKVLRVVEITAVEELSFSEFRKNVLLNYKYCHVRFV
jgi:hypothetical protein